MRRPPRYAAHPAAAGLDVPALERDLRDAVRGQVRFDAGARGAYATDASNFRQVPVGVVLPADVDDVVSAVAACRAHGAPVVNRGAGTGLAGQTTNVAVIIDTSRHVRRVVDIDTARRTATVEPGCVLDSLQAVTRPGGLEFGPDPATHSRCTIGGMIGNDSCGAHSLVTGRTSHNVASLDVLLYDGTRMTVGPTPPDELERRCRLPGREGEVYRGLRHLAATEGDRIRTRYPTLRRRVSGYALDALLPEAGFDVARALVGTEGTCVTVLGATLRLVPRPPARALAVAGYTDVFAAADAVTAVLPHGPHALEGVDATMAAAMRRRAEGGGRFRLPAGAAFLLAEMVGDSADEAAARARAVAEAMQRTAVAVEIVTDAGSQAAVWDVREAAVGTVARLPEGDTWPGWEDAAVPPENLGGYLRRLDALYRSYGYTTAYYGHFGEGCIHARSTFDLVTDEGVAAYRRFLEEAADLVVAHEGSLSGEHGDGQQRGPLLARMYGEELVDAFRRFKGIWDPDGRMNPGKLVDPLRAFGVDENLRLAGAPAIDPETVFAFASDEGSFRRATLRCVGVGKCRRPGGGTMCPSYMVTGDEEHSTRGRARLLFEMLEGEVVDTGWRSPEVREALDLCLACKGCKTDCPAGVDMATYKAEFLFHHFRGRIRPRPAYALGLIMYSARLAARAPRLANAATHAPGVAALFKRAAGLDPRRGAPSFAPVTFRRWFQRRAPAAGANGDGRPVGAPGAAGAEGAGRPVVLFPDTFTNFLSPDVGRAAVEVLEAAGLQVTVPAPVLCCGRPLFDYGMLPTARRLLRRTLDVLTPLVDAGMPVVVPEPSCAVALRDELVDLFPNDPAARRLADATTTVAGAVRDAGWSPPAVTDPVLLQVHCHQGAVLGTDADRWLLDAAGASWEAPDSGCCGLAGSFGYEKGKYDLSVACAERVLAPAVREAPAGTVVVADGFSCRSQIEHTTGVEAVHSAQLLAARLDRSGGTRSGSEPESESESGSRSRSRAWSWRVNHRFSAGD